MQIGARRRTRNARIKKVADGEKKKKRSCADGEKKKKRSSASVERNVQRTLADFSSSLTSLGRASAPKTSPSCPFYTAFKRTSRL